MRPGGRLYILICAYNVAGQEGKTDPSSFIEALAFIILNTTSLNTVALTS